MKLQTQYLGSSENIKQSIGRITVIFSCKVLTDEELTDESFTGGDVTVRFDPHTAVRFPSTLFNAFLNACEKFGIVLTNKICMTGSALNKDEIFVLFHEVKNR